MTLPTTTCRAGWPGLAPAALVAAVVFWAPATPAAVSEAAHDGQVSMAHEIDGGHADHGPPAPEWSADEALAYSQAARGRVPDDHSLTDSTGATFSLHQLRGQPLVVSLIYTSCYHTCPIITQTLKRAVAIGDDAFGPGHYQVLTLGFDSANDSPVRMNSFMKQHGVSRPGWRAASGEAQVIQDLTAELGFIFFASTKGFDHLAQTTVLDAEGRVYRQVYGEDFEPPALVEPLKELIYGVPARESSVSGWVAGIKLFCTVYDPKAGRYRFDITPFISIGFATTILVALLIIGWRSVRTWRRERAARPDNLRGGD